MRKDIFIDASIANKFANTKDEHLKVLIEWLQKVSKKKEDKEKDSAYLLVSDYLRKEYFDGNQHCNKQYSITMIYTELQKQDRLHIKSKREIEAFQNKFFTKKVWKNLKCKTNDTEDPHHIALILLSDRRIALIEDDNFITDLINFPMKGIDGMPAVAAKTPENLNYK